MYTSSTVENDHPEVNNMYKIKEKEIKKIKSIDLCRSSGLVLDLRKVHPNINVSSIKIWNKEKVLISFVDYEGVYVVLDALSHQQQLSLTKMTLDEYIQPPNISNVSGQLPNLWQKYVEEEQIRQNNPTKISRKSYLFSLRWVTLGYHYNWTSRQYVSYFNEFPPELSQLCSDIVTALPCNWTLNAQSAIVNIYPENAMMGGHQDDAEFSKEHPVVSLSLGCTCVFLIGGFDKETTPLAIFLQSGDALIFGGSSRLRYHGVPKVFTGDPNIAFLNLLINKSTPEMTEENESHLLAPFEDDLPGISEDEKSLLVGYMRNTRININVRQVYSEVSPEYSSTS